MTFPHVFANLPGPIPLQYLDDNFNSIAALTIVGQVTTIAALRMAPKTGAGILHMLGYATPGDGGQGWFYYVPSDTTSVDDGGTIIVAADGGRWYRDYSGDVDVCWFGADRTGTNDSTVAFNLATKSTYVPSGIFDLGFPSGVLASKGAYRLTDTVYIHKGQHLHGAGEGATHILLDTISGGSQKIFKLGYNSTGQDAGGLPPEISELWFYGGPAGGYNVFIDVNGGTIHNLFMTSPGTGIGVFGTDTRVETIQIDQGLTGIAVGGHTHEFNNVMLWNTNFALQTSNGTTSSCSDIAFNNCEFTYTQYAGVLFNAGVNHSGLQFNNCLFDTNQQFGTFLAYILLACNSAAGIKFNGCQFINMNGPAYLHQNGLSNVLEFDDCTFDGNISTSGYTQSTTAYAANTINDNLYFSECNFFNLKAAPIQTNGTTTGIGRIVIQGGRAAANAGTNFFLVGATAPTNGSLISVRRLDQINTTAPIVPALASGWSIEMEDVAYTFSTAGTTGVLPVGRNSTFFLDATAGVITVPLPRTDSAIYKPGHGDVQFWVDAKNNWATNPPVFLPGTGTINGSGSNYSPTGSGGSLLVTYDSVNNNWVAQRSALTGGGMLSTTLVTNRYSAGGVVSGIFDPTIGGGGVNVPIPNVAANTLTQVLSLTGRGELPLCGVWSINTTARTMRIQVVIDGVTVFNPPATSNGSSNFVGLYASGGPESYGKLYYNSSCVVSIASSVVNDSAGCALAYIEHHN